MTLSDDQIRELIDSTHKAISEMSKKIDELKQDVKDSAFNLSLEVQFRKRLSARVTVLEEMVNRMSGDGK